MNALNTGFFREWTASSPRSPARGHQGGHYHREGKAFAAGPISPKWSPRPRTTPELLQVGQRTFRSLELLEKTVIAAVNGFAWGRL